MIIKMSNPIIVQEGGMFGMAFSLQGLCFTTHNMFCFVNPEYSGNPYRWTSWLMPNDLRFCREAM
jgi:hypothetical protein